MRKTLRNTSAVERPIGLLQATAMVVGIIIGASIFVQPSEINRHVPSVPGVLSVWAVAGVLTLFGSMVCAELSSVFPRTGGVYVFLKETLSPACGFLWGWAMFWSAHSGIVAASSVVLARYVAYFVPLGDTGIRAAAITAILALSFINYLGARQGSRLQTLVTIAKVAAIVLLMNAGLFRIRRRPDYSPPYRAWGYSVFPLAFAVSAVVVAVIQIAADPLQAATGLLFVVLGLPVYYIWLRPHANR